MSQAHPPVVLSIAGSDSGGGAGIQADLRTFFASGVHGMTAITAVTVQNSVGVQGYTEIPPNVVAEQIESVVTDIGVGAVKTGMLPSAAIIETVAEVCDKVHIGRSTDVPFIVDPVAASMHGDPLLAEDALDALRKTLFPRATLITPNLDEIRLLTGVEVRGAEDARRAADALLEFGPAWVLVKGGHLADAPDCVDFLTDGRDFVALPGPRYDTQNTHGGGDTMAAAITAALARGMAVPEAVRYGKWFVSRAVAESYTLGKGVGPVSAFWALAPNEYLMPLTGDEPLLRLANADRVDDHPVP